jgi:hypothetical protein
MDEVLRKTLVLENPENFLASTEEKKEGPRFEITEGVMASS